MQYELQTTTTYSATLQITPKKVNVTHKSKNLKKILSNYTMNKMLA